MQSKSLLRCCWLAVVGAVACGGGESIAPSNEPPAKIEAISDLTRTGSVGAAVPGGVAVRVSDASGRPVQGASVAFAVTLGNGSATPRVAVTDSKGEATAAWTIGTVVGTNEVTASVTGVSTSIKFQATGAAGSVNAVSLSSASVRLLTNVDTTRITAKAIDVFGNTTSPAPVFTVRDPTLISIDPSGLVRALRRGAGTYVVATAGTKSDSVLVTVLAVGQSICTAVANPIELAIGQVVSDVSAAGLCIHASTANAEYALVPFYNSAVSSATIQVEVRPLGTAPLSLTSLADYSRSVSFQAPPTLMPDYAAESRMRSQERVEVAARLGGMRNDLSARRTIVGGAVQAAVPAIGDIMKLNTNAFDFCDNPDVRTGRVVAVTDKAIVVADTANPAGGFTSEEYRSIGVTFDTLVDPVDRKAFGDPSDIDGNGRAIMFFTRAVNELTAASSGSVYLGFFYQRDLFPKTVAPGPCVGSNLGEVLYLLVPDTAGVVNSNKRTKTQVLSFTLGTVAHEYQHLINASRRMYVNNVGTNFEEKWLDEGLAHIAEDLNFWASSKRSPRSNVDNGVFTDPLGGPAYTAFAQFNATRYGRYLTHTEAQAPVGFDAGDDDLETRGAIWSFLRYAADRMPAGSENEFWFGLVNSKTSGLANIGNAIGAAPSAWLRDWAISVFMDDNAVGVDTRFKQPSWNLRSVLTNGGVSLAFPLATRLLTSGASNPMTLAGNGVSFLRFSVANGQDALLTVTSGSQPLPSTVQLAVVRVR